MNQATRTPYHDDTFVNASSGLVNAVTAMMIAVTPTMYRPIPIKPEVASQIRLFTYSAPQRYATIAACYKGDWVNFRGAIQGVTKEQFHPTINLACSLLGQLPATEASALMARIDDAMEKGVITAQHQHDIRKMFKEHNITIPCKELREALTAIPNTKKDNPNEIDPKRIAGKKLAEALAGCRDFQAVINDFLGQTPAPETTATTPVPSTEPSR